MSEDKDTAGMWEHDMSKDKTVFSNFGLMIPSPFEPPPRRRYITIKIPVPAYPKWLDKLLKPLCKYGIHHYRCLYTFYQYGNTSSPFGEDVYRCSRCKKTKCKPVKSK